MLLSTIFNRHSLEFSHFSDAPVVHTNNWNILIMVVLLAVLAIVVATSRGKVSQILKALVLPRYFSLLQRDGKIVEQRIFRVMLVFNIATFALGVTTWLELYHPELIARFTYLGCYGLSFLALFVLYFLKVLFLNLYAYLFDHQKDKPLLHQHKFIFITAAALALYLILALVIFTHLLQAINVFFIVLLILVCLYFYNSYKINPRSFKLFHFFIYFCTLEILPYLILVKFILTV